MPKLELTSDQNAKLLHGSKTQARQEQKRYLESLGGDGSAQELDFALTFARSDSSALEESKRLNARWYADRHPAAGPVSPSVSQAVSFFLHSLIAGDFGPDDSRDGRSRAFLEKPQIVASTASIFIDRLLVDREGEVVNHDEAEKHAVDYLQDYVD